MTGPTTDSLVRLEQRRQTLREALDAAPVALRSARPGPERWSVDEIVEHLALVEASIVRLLERRLGAPPPAMPAGQDAAADFTAERVLDRTRSVVATPRTVPRGGVSAETSWVALTQSRAGLERLIRTAAGVDTGSIRVPHPAFGALDFDQWVEFVGLHELRHAAQMRETIAALGG